ncbi:thiol-disulfide isomerase/thioredoxin [Hamadaea flava]|uniref:Thioredoxin domain-containing protein n=1 Tax=Hamadaea flava TaxID=1742688 RepID=A0ABV8LQJ7_9ACTN|nr:hypothetical protein [Hamadaea flava]MCP2322879.1 thiol-disulfide isomerase/thioredoxin [Hamadaea flava]
MPVLIAIATFAAVLGLLNLLLLLGVVRRIREHTKLLDALYEVVGATPGLTSQVAATAVGDVVGAFGATATDGAPVNRELIADGTVVAFLSPDCQACHEQLPDLVAWAAAQDRDQVLVVVDGRSGDPEPLVTMLEPVTRVVVDDAAAPFADAFGVRAFPTFFRLDAGGRVTGRGTRLSRLPASAAA